jgi:predicted nucleic acid-binding protein
VSLRFLLDANILSEPLKPIPHPVVLAQIERHRAESATAAPVWNELVYGCRRLHDLVLVTRNEADFAAFEELRMENWWEL